MRLGKKSTKRTNNWAKIKNQQNLFKPIIFKRVKNH